MDFAQALSTYDYTLPKELIAQAPATPRDSARLLVHDRRTHTTQLSRFSHLGDFLPAGALLVLNRTKVIPARLPMKRRDGSMIELLLLGTDARIIHALAPKKLTPGETLWIDKTHACVVDDRDKHAWRLTLQCDAKTFSRLLERYGIPPLPPYIDRSPLSRRSIKERYQTVFARDAGSIAAPTASLHFTDRLLKKLRKNGIQTADVTLHVHLGTFAPLKEDQWQSGALHREEYSIDGHNVKVIEQALRDGRPIVAVGTTVVRTLESAFDRHHQCVQPRGETTLFIREGYVFKVVDHLITNFHVPKSSLLMLVSAFAGRATVQGLYERAIQERMRFFSFGDAMLVL